MAVEIPMGLEGYRSLKIARYVNFHF